MAMSPELVHYMETFELPPGTSLKDYLAEFDSEMNGNPPAVAEYLERVPVAEVAGWRLTADVAVPEGSGGEWPVLLWFHGGGWIVGSPWSHRRLIREFAHRGYLTVSVDYRRAPKHRFPAAVEDGSTALAWTIAESVRFGGDADRLAIGGDSAGANLAAATCVTAADRSAVRAAVLLYGIYDYHRALATIPSFANIVGGAGSEDQLYVDPAQFESLRDDPRLNPERACSQLPPCHLGVGSRDPLYPETLALARCLERHGVEVDLDAVDGAPHSFFQLPGHPSYGDAFDRVARFLGRHLD